jgi:hypothetical protein
VAALQALGVEVQREQDDEVYALCPMHMERVGKADTKPSWSVNRLTGLNHCFSCGYSSDFVGLVMDVLKCNTAEAIRWVKRNGMVLGILDTIPGRLDPPGVKKKPERLVPEAVLTGFVPPPEKALQSRYVTAEAAAAYGVLWDEEEDGWIIPIRWPDGLLLGWQFKKGHVVLNEPKKMRKRGALFGVHVFRHGRMILVESPLDCLRLYSEGIEGGVSSFGAHVSDEQVRIITENATSLYIALDNDAPGRKESRRLAHRLGRQLPTFVFNYEGAEALPGKTGKDPGELTRASLYRGLTQATYSLEL